MLLFPLSAPAGTEYISLVKQSCCSGKNPTGLIVISYEQLPHVLVILILFLYIFQTKSDTYMYIIKNN